jgi:hypothetical protein
MMLLALPLYKTCSTIQLRAADEMSTTVCTPSSLYVSKFGKGANNILQDFVIYGEDQSKLALCIIFLI